MISQKKSLSDFERLFSNICDMMFIQLRFNIAPPAGGSTLVVFNVKGK